MCGLPVRDVKQIDGLEPRPWLTRLPPGELLPQHEILHRQFAVRAKRGAQCPKKDPKPSDHDPVNSGSARQNRKTIATDDFSERTGLVTRTTHLTRDLVHVY